MNKNKAGKSWNFKLVLDEKSFTPHIRFLLLLKSF